MKAVASKVESRFNQRDENRLMWWGFATMLIVGFLSVLPFAAIFGVALLLNSL